MDRQDVRLVRWLKDERPSVRRFGARPIAVNHQLVDRNSKCRRDCRYEMQGNAFVRAIEEPAKA
jgi:hypothetical protein